MKFYLVTAFIAFFLPVLSQDIGDFEYLDRVYDEKIKTVQLYPLQPGSEAQMFHPVIPLRDHTPLILEFDELFEDARNYRVMLIHCRANWQPSGLAALRYLDEYNEFDILDFEYSFNTLTPYVHYLFEVPRPTLPGNYLLVVYDADDESRVIITRRFLVFDPQVIISPKAEIIANAPYSPDRQQLQFTVNYGMVELLDPMSYVNVHILQNGRWDNAKLNLKPTFVREDRHLLEYRHYTPENSFAAGNEFRYFDIRSLKYFGHHVRHVSFRQNKIYAWLEKDKPRNHLAYSFEVNMRGQYFIDNIEQKIPDIENDYALVSFTLECPPRQDEVYISGRFTDWRKDENTRMRYNPASGAYEGSLVLKQGQYAYQYVLGNPERENDIEGNKRETRNRYTILVYYYSQTLRTDLLIGYYSFIYDLRP